MNSIRRDLNPRAIVNVVADVQAAKPRTTPCVGIRLRLFQPKNAPNLKGCDAAAIGRAAKAAERSRAIAS